MIQHPSTSSPIEEISQKATILVVEDHPFYRKTIKDSLEQNGHNVIEAVDGKEAIELVLEKKPDLVLLDINLPSKLQGYEVCRIITGPNIPYMPVIFMSELGDEGDLDVMRHVGGADFVRKTSPLFELEARIQFRLRDAREQAELKAKAVIDRLTGLHNQGAYEDMLEREIARSRRFKHSVSVIFFDLDFFKRFNDRYGHLAGNHALKRFAEILRDNVRMHDVPFRYGGEEFAVILPETTEVDAVDVAERVRRALQYSPMELGNERVGITTSAGVCEMHPSDVSRDTSAEELVQIVTKRSDDAMYRAKEEGKNRVVAYSSITTSQPH